MVDTSNPNTDYSLIKFDNEEYSEARVLNCININSLKDTKSVRQLAYSNKFGLLFAVNGVNISVKNHENFKASVEIMKTENEIDEGTADQNF